MDVSGEIKSILRDILDIRDGEIHGTSSLMDDLGAESIDLLELAATLHTRFVIEIREEDIFLADCGRRLQEEDTPFPFLPGHRLRELAGDPGVETPVTVQDLVWYVTWQLQKGRGDDPP